MKSVIDTELRNDILAFLNNCRLPGYTYDLSVPEGLYFNLKPQRTRKIKEKDNGFVTADGSPVDLTQAMTNLA